MDMVIEQHEALPNPDTDLDLVERQAIQLKEKTSTYMDNVINSYKTTLTEKRNKALALKDIIKEKGQEVVKLQQDIRNYESEQAEIKALEEETKDMEAKLENIRKNQTVVRQKMADQQKAYGTVKRKLDIFKKSTGMVCYPIRENHLKFDFTLIDKQQPDKVFTFTLHTAVDGIYKVEECDPMIPNLDTLTENLNQHRDPYHFVKLIRREFCAMVPISTLALAATSSSPPPSTPLSPSRPLAQAPVLTSPAASSPPPAPTSPTMFSSTPPPTSPPMGSSTPAQTSPTMGSSTPAQTSKSPASRSSSPS